MRQTPPKPILTRLPPEEPVKYRMQAKVEFIARPRFGDGYDARGSGIQQAVRKALRIALAEEFTAGRLDLPNVTVEFELEEESYEATQDWQYEYNSGD